MATLCSAPCCSKRFAYQSAGLVECIWGALCCRMAAQARILHGLGSGHGLFFSSALGGKRSSHDHIKVRSACEVPPCHHLTEGFSQQRRLRARRRRQGLTSPCCKRGAPTRGPHCTPNAQTTAWPDAGHGKATHPWRSSSLALCCADWA